MFKNLNKKQTQIFIILYLFSFKTEFYNVTFIKKSLKDVIIVNHSFRINFRINFYIYEIILLHHFKRKLTIEICPPFYIQLRLEMFKVYFLNTIFS